MKVFLLKTKNATSPDKNFGFCSWSSMVRKYTQQIELQLGIKGFVINLADHSVYLETVCEDEQLQKVIKWYHGGLPKSNGQNVEIEESINLIFFERV